MIVLSTALVVMILGIGGVHTASSAAARHKAWRDEADARRLAMSAVELALSDAQNTTAWRTTAGGGALFTDLQLGDGYISASVTDAVDGNAANNLDDPIVISGIGRTGSSRQMFRVTASPNATTSSSLDGAMHSNGPMSINSAIVRSASSIGSNRTVTATGGTVKADVYAVGSISGATFHGAKTTMVAAKPMPGPNAITYYSSLATAIPYTSITNSKFRRTVLSATRNPSGGGVNARGIYSINCEGGKLVIEDCRIAATLIITNCSALTVESSVHMDAGEPGLPTLIVSGNLEINTAAGDLEESTYGNFNPAGTPYEGVADSDSTDSYPSILNGLIYASGNVTLKGKVTVVGTLVAGDAITVNSGAVVSLTRRLTGSPPLFVPVQFQVDSTTWVRTIN